jgi:release factor glutamine methyltransferase
VLASRLSGVGFVDAHEEAREMIEAAYGGDAVLHCWLTRRLAGEPLAWLTGFATFAGHRVLVDRNLYVPRPQTELLARRAMELLPERGLAADLCTGTGALAVALRRAHRHARVVGTDIDPNAVGCAAKNGVEVYQGHLADPLPHALFGHVDVVVAVVPYVPTEEMIFLPRDVREYEPRRALDGGRNGMLLLEQAAVSGAQLLHVGGSLLLELGGNQDRLLLPALDQAGFSLTARIHDDEGDLRGIEARLDRGWTARPCSFESKRQNERDRPRTI